MRGWSVFTRPPSISGDVGHVLDALDRQAELSQEGGGAAAGARARQPSSASPRANTSSPVLVVRGDQRAHSSLTTFGSSRCSTSWMRSCSVVGVSSGSTGTRSCASTGPLSTPSSTKCTVAPDSLDAGGELLLDRVRAGEAGQQRGVDVDDRVGEAVEERRCQQVHVAGEHDELDALLLEPVRHRRVARGAVGVSRRARTHGRIAASGARRSAGASRRFDATATTGRPASSSACRFVPSPLTSTPITRSLRSRARPARRFRRRRRR